MSRVRSTSRERKRLAEVLRNARSSAGLTAAQVEAKTGIGPATLSLIENAIQEPTVPQLRALAGAYGVEVPDFFAAEAANG